MIVVALSPAMRSALECRADVLDPALLAAWDGASRLSCSPDQFGALLADLIEAANGEDGDAEQNTDPEMRAFARRACRSLSAAADRLILAARACGVAR